jgi:hypothetical protein
MRREGKNNPKNSVSRYLNAPYNDNYCQENQSYYACMETIYMSFIRDRETYVYTVKGAFF